MAYNKTAARRHRRQIASEIAIINAGGNQSLGGSIRPRGRAPRGMGGEYAARRAIADRVDTLDRTVGTLNRTLATSRGLSKHGRRDTAARARLGLLKKARNDAERVIRSQGDWTFKREMVNVIIGAASAQYLS